MLILEKVRLCSMAHVKLFSLQTLFCIILTKREKIVGIVCSYLKEAKLLIEWLNLKRKNDKFLIYENKKYSLIISNQGKINSSIATTYLLSTRNISNIVNFGIAGSSEYRIGEIFLVNKINNKFFPDILINHPFKESEIICFDEVITEGRFKLVDMESEGFFIGATKFLKSHNIFLIKIVSDNLVCFRPTDEFMYNLIAPHKEKILNFLSLLPEKKEIDFSEIEDLAKKYNLSFSQKEKLKDFFVYYKLNNLTFPKFDFEKTNKKKDFERIINELKNF